MNKKKLTFDAFIVKTKIHKEAVTTLSPYQQSKIIGGSDGLVSGTASRRGSGGV